MGVSRTLVDKSHPQDGCHLDIVGHLKLRGGGREEGGHMDTEEAGGGHIHCATPTHKHANM